jgi:hypothetical protein
MAAFVIISILLACCFAAPFVGVDARIREDRDRRGWWPGTQARR